MDRLSRLVLGFLVFWTTFIVILVFVSLHIPGPNQETTTTACPNMTTSGPQIIVTQKDGTLKTYDRSSPLIFIGGFPRSGTTLIRSMLDAHSAIRCGKETRVLPRILAMAHNWNTSEKESKRLNQAKLTEEILNDAVAAFILEVKVVAKHGESAERLCNKDPFTLRWGNVLYRLFPNAKFIFIIRDGRAVVHSMVTRNISITGYDLNDYSGCLEKWSKHVRLLYIECNRLGDKFCLKVKYETLVLNLKPEMERILKFLEEPWEDAVLHHEDYIGIPGGVDLSKLERSTDQVMEPVNNKSISKWVGKIPEKIVKNMESIAPMLSVLGYDPLANPPNYSHPDPPNGNVPPEVDEY